ncbi:MAG TPA: YdcF family protein [Lachnospiraceae bacterium]|nr:YdcF family protein [Lachnospiraceae bacterium]
MGILLVILGVICIAYCIGIMFFVSHGSNFYLIWGFMGMALIFWGRYYTWYIEHVPSIVKKLVLIGVSAMLLLFVLIEGMIISGFVKTAPKELDYIIVLGAQLKEYGPSYSLQMRLDQAYGYLKENKNTKVIVSGGQGSNEPYTEAQGMYEYLVKKGISPNRIIKEDQSMNTHQNLMFSSKYINTKSDNVGIVTSNFHVFRALHLAKALGFQRVYGIASKAYIPLLPNNMFREFLSIIKDFLFGNLT